MGTITKRLIGSPDSNRWDGTSTETYTAETSTSRTMTLWKDGANPDYAHHHRFGDIITRGPWVDVRAYDASGSSTATTGSITVGYATLTLASAIDFKNRQGIRVVGAGAAGADHITTIVSGAGTVNLVLAEVAETTVAAADVYHSDSEQIDAATAAIVSAGGGTVVFSPGTYVLGANVAIPATVKFLPMEGAVISRGTFTFTLADGCAKEVWPETFGAKPDGATDSGEAINDAIAAVKASFIPVVLNTGTYIIEETIVLYDGIILRGQGITSTVLQATDSDLNSTVIKTAGFDNEDADVNPGFTSGFTQTNAYLLAVNHWPDVPKNFEIRDIAIDGNSANQSSGNGIDLYGKAFIVENVRIHDAYGVGFYSEGATTGGQDDWKDYPEARISNLKVRDCGSHGVHYRGPHDGSIESVWSNSNTGAGAFFETLIGNGAGVYYSGTCDIGEIHTYANYGGGMDVRATIRASLVYVDNEWVGHNIRFRTGAAGDCGGRRSLISQIYSLGADKSDAGTYYHVYVEDDDINIGSLRIHNSNESAGGVYVAGTALNIGTCVIDGKSKAGIGINHVSNGQFMVSGIVKGWKDTGGVGLQTDFANNSSHYKLTISNCETCWSNSTAGIANIYDLILYSLADQTDYSGVAPEDSVSEIFNVRVSDTNTGHKRVSDILHQRPDGFINSNRVQVVYRTYSSIAGGAGATSVWSLATNGNVAYFLEADVIANQSNQGARAAYKVHATASNTGVVTTVHNSTNTYEYETNAAWDCAFVANGDDIELQCTPDAAQITEFIAVIKVLRVHKTAASNE